jgi:DNA-binding transcriptional MerR regulator
MQSYTATEAAEKLGIKIERFRDWITKDLIVPSIQKTGKIKGKKNLFSRYDLYRIHLFNKLLEFGIKRSRAGKLSSIKFEDLDSEGYLYSVDIVRCKGELLEISGKLINDLSEIKFNRDDGFLVVINLAEMKNAVDNILSS